MFYVLPLSYLSNMPKQIKTRDAHVTLTCFTFYLLPIVRYNAC